jgi:hypothetical protein
MAIVQMNGNLTISKSKGWDEAVKEEILNTPEGKERMLRLLLLDSAGNEVILQGRVYKSKNGGLTARFNCKADAEIVEIGDVDQEDGVESKNVENLAAELGL